MRPPVPGDARARSGRPLNCAATTTDTPGCSGPSSTRQRRRYEHRPSTRSAASSAVSALDCLHLGIHQNYFPHRLDRRIPTYEGTDRYGSPQVCHTGRSRRRGDYVEQKARRCVCGGVRSAPADRSDNSPPRAGRQTGVVRINSTRRSTPAVKPCPTNASAARAVGGDDSAFGSPTATSASVRGVLRRAPPH